LSPTSLFAPQPFKLITFFQIIKSLNARLINS
jgi:hypothetical protein